MADNVRVPAGKLFCFSSGEYSDYGYEGHYLALVDITGELLEQAKENAKERANVTPDAGGNLPEEDYELEYGTRQFFIPELLKLGAMLDIDCAEIHIGSYGQLDFS